MTPLLHRIVKELTLPKGARTFEDFGGVLPRIADVHCFEMTEVWPLAVALAQDLMMRAHGTAHFDLMDVQTFLPAPVTWLERIDSHGTREGYLLRSDPDGKYATVRVAAGDADNFFSPESVGALWLKPSTTDLHHPGWRAALEGWVEDETMPSAAWGTTFILYALLAIINTPRIIGRKQHMPHRGLERALTRTLGVGKFPLLAWTELKLSVSTREAGDDEHEAHLTGKKCLHFCRAHLRVRNGHLEMVKAHWRGDAALGIKRTRYRMTA